MTTARNMASSAAGAAEQSWSWWTNMNESAAIRVQNVSDAEDDDGSDAPPDSKMPRLEDDDGYCWNDSTTVACPLDLSMKATVTTTTTTTTVQQQQKPCRGRRSESDVYATTPVKKKSAAVGKLSSKKTAGKTTAAANAIGVRPSAIKAVTRKLLPQLMLDRTSPVSGTIITTIANSTGDSATAEDDYDGDDIDPEYNIVVATDDARRRLESIPNVLGPYRCRLCGVRYSDAFALARHRCRCIVHVRYRCPECDKVFQCPANLASHRRWHGTAASVKTAGGDRGQCKLDATCNNNNNNNNNDDTDGDEENVVAGESTIARVDSAAVTVSCTGSVTTTAGFKKNILQRAVRAAAAAAVRIHDENGACT